MKKQFKFKEPNPYSCFADTKLSWKAKGIAAYLMTAGSEVSMSTNDLVLISKEKEDSLDSGLNELLRNGYIVEVG